MRFLSLWMVLLSVSAAGSERNTYSVAYQENLSAALHEVAMAHQIPIVFRRTSEEAEGYQEIGYPTKPQMIKNKSSMLEGMKGLIPCNPLAGKTGAKWRELKAQCPLKKDHAYFSCMHRLRTVESFLQQEIEMMESLLQKRDFFGAPLYQKSQVQRKKNGKTQVLVYTSSSARKTRWVTEQDADPALVAYALSDAKSGVPITADTDLVLIGLPKCERHSVIYDPIQGFRTAYTDGILNELNQGWQKYSHQTNRIIQHADEANFGLNAFDEELVAVSHDGRDARFDLRQCNASRMDALKAYGAWLKAESRFADILTPSPEVQKARHDYLLEHYHLDLDYTAATEDYQVIREILGPEAVTPEIEFQFSKN